MGTVSLFAFLSYGQQFWHFPYDVIITLWAMGFQTLGTVFNSLLHISKRAAAFITQSIQRAVAKEAVEALLIRALVAGKIFTFSILKKAI